MTRERLPDRRESENFTFTLNGKRCHGSVGFYQDGRVGEVFLDVGKPGSDQRIAAAEAAVGASIALQEGGDIETLRKAMPRLEDGAPQGPLGQLLDMIAKEDSA